MDSKIKYKVQIIIILKKMSKFRHAKRDAKKAAFAAKQEKEGRKVINWIFAFLILLGIIYALYSIAFVG